MASLTPKQEKFAQEVASGKTQSDAYRAAFNVRPNTKPLSVNQAASKLMADPNIASRVDALRKPIAESAQITLESHLERLKHLGQMAEASEKWDAAIKAEIGRAKAAGIIVEKAEVKHSGEIVLQISSDDAEL